MPITPVGNEFTIALSSGSNSPEPRMVTLLDGRVVTAWFDIGSGAGDIRHRIVDVDGTLIGGESITPADTTGQQTEPAIAALATGGWVVAWQDFRTDASGDIRYRVYDQAGNPVAAGLATQGEQSGGGQGDVSVTGLPGGGFILAWSDRNDTNSGIAGNNDTLVGREYDLTGTAVGGIVRLSGLNGSALDSEIQMGDTELVGIWDDNGLDQIAVGLFSNGLPGSDQTDDGTNVGSGEVAREPDLALGPDRAMFVYESGGSVQYRLFDENLMGIVGGPVSTSGFSQSDARVVALPQGGFLVVWEEFRNAPGNFTSFDIFAQQFDADGLLVNGPVNLTEGQTGAETDPEITAMIDGRVMVSWTSQGAAGDVIGRIYDPRTTAIQFEGGSSGEGVWGTNIAGQGDILNGNAGNDRLWGQAGADRLNGGQGNDTMIGGLGNDQYFVDSLGDVVAGEVAFGSGGGIDTVTTSVDFTAPVNVEILRAAAGAAGVDLTGNDAPGTLVGNDFANRLDGRGGNDQINGNAGNDTLTGGEGTDTLVGGAGADQFVFNAVSNSRAGAANRDVINGFDRGATQDIINLDPIDANTGVAGDQDFTFIGTGAFTGAGQVRVVSLGGPNACIVEVNVNSDLAADMQIFVNLRTNMVAGDFDL
jgi:Ca2+-binding RTX toxin-like protein